MLQVRTAPDHHVGYNAGTLPFIAGMSDHPPSRTPGTLRPDETAPEKPRIMILGRQEKTRIVILLR